LGTNRDSDYPQGPSRKEITGSPPVVRLRRRGSEG